MNEGRVMMAKRRIVKEDGRYLIFYSFGARPGGQDGGPAGAATTTGMGEAPAEAAGTDRPAAETARANRPHPFAAPGKEF